MPLLNFFVARRYLVMAAVEEVLQHPEKVEINEARRFAEQERVVHQHLLEGHQHHIEFFQPLTLVSAPLIEATATELAFLEAEILQLIGGADEFLIMNIVQAKSRAFHVVLNEVPLNALHAFKFCRKETEAEFRVEVFADDLRIFVEFKHIGSAIHEQRDTVITLAGEFPDKRAVLRGDIDDLKRGSRVFQNATLNEAEWTPRKLNQFNHVIFCLTKSTLVLSCKRAKRK